MAARRRKSAKPRPAAPPADATRLCTVVLEDLRGQMKAVGEGQQLLKDRMDGLSDGQRLLSDRVEALGNGQRLLTDRMEAGFEQIDRRFERVEHDIGLLKDASLEHRRELKRHGQLLDEHGRELRRHGQLLDEHGQELKVHGRLLVEIRGAIDGKADRDEASCGA